MPAGFRQGAVIRWLDKPPSLRVFQYTDPMNKLALLQHLQLRIPHLLAVYAFGSRISGHARVGSDLDLAVLVAGYADPVLLFDVAGELADMGDYSGDLLDLRAASTVMQYQVITTGQCWWAKDGQAAVYETFILGEKLKLDAARYFRAAHPCRRD